jgi:hypothetical protein
MQLLSKGEQAHQQQNQTLQAPNAYDSCNIFLQTIQTYMVVQT